jgi:hypothetical protein
MFESFRRVFWLEGALVLQAAFTSRKLPRRKEVRLRRLYPVLVGTALFEIAFVLWVIGIVRPLSLTGGW